MPLTVSWFTPVRHRDYNRMASSLWIRCYQLLPYLLQHGVVSTVNDAQKRANISVFVRWQDDDAATLARRLKQRGDRVVFDLVASYFEEVDVPHLGKVVTQKHIDEARRMMSMADAVTCCSASIAGRAKEYHPSAVYVPDSVDGAHFDRVKDRTDFLRPRLRAIWSGWTGKARELEPLIPLLEGRQIDLTLITNRRPWLARRTPLQRKSYRARYRRWRYERFPAQIVEGDFCISHRPVDNPYNQGHSHFKIAIFMREGVPALASPVPSYVELLGGGKGGRICATVSEWERALDKIRCDRRLLQRWSDEARRLVEPFLTERVASRYADLFRGILAHGEAMRGSPARSAGNDGARAVETAADKELGAARGG